MKKKVTQWFPPSIQPTRPGVYQTASKDMRKLKINGFQYWNGKWWGCYEYSAEAAYAGRQYQSVFQGRHWRGLAEKP